MCDYCHSFVDVALSGCTKSWAETMEEDFTFQCTGCLKVECLTAELARLTDIVKGMEMRITKETDGRGRKEQCSDKKGEDSILRGGRASARKANGERTSDNMACRKVTGEKVTVDEGVTMGQEMIEADATGGKTKGRKELRVDVTKRKSITRMVSGRKEAGKKGTEKAAGGKVSNQGDAKRRSYSEAVIEVALRTERVFMGDSILRKTDKTLCKHSPNISTDEKIQNAINEVSKRDCIIMGDFNHGRIQWKSQQSTGSEDQTILNLVQDSFLTQHVLELTRGENVLDIVLSSQKEFIDNVRIYEPLGCIDHNQIYFIIKVKGEQNRKIRYRKKFHKGRL